MKKLIEFILLTVLRDKFYLSLLIILMAIFGLSNFIGSLALTECNQMKLVYFMFLSRIIVISGIIIFICYYINKQLINKEIDFILAKPISRNAFILSYWLSFTLISLLPIFFIVLISLIYSNILNFYGLLWWFVSFILEANIVIVFTIATSLILKNLIASVLSTFSFYFASRMMGFFVYSIPMIKISNIFYDKNSFFNGILKILSIIFPRLDLYCKTEWLLYGIKNKTDIYIILFQSFIYIPLILFITFNDFKKNEFK